MLLLRKNHDSENDESYVVLSDGRYVGRIFYAGAGAPKDRPWSNSTNGKDVKACGNPADREAAMAAFKATSESR